jgi:TonB family protein
MQRATTALGFAMLFTCCECVAAPSPEQQLASRALVVQCLQAAPKPYYSEFTAAHHFRGNGLFILRIRVKTGRVVEVRIAQSTSHPSLDAAAVRALSDWRFKPGCLKPVTGTEDALLRIPVTFAIQD